LIVKFRRLTILTSFTLSQ